MIIDANDQTRTVTAYTSPGVVATATSEVLAVMGGASNPRPYTEAENLAADARAADAQRRAMLLSYDEGIVSQGIQWLSEAQDVARADAINSTNLAGAIATTRKAASDQAVAINSWTPSATYKQSDLTAIKTQLKAIADRQVLIIDAINHSNEWRIKVDVALERTMQAVEWIARGMTKHTD